MEERSFAKKLIFLVLPMAFSQLMLAAVSVSDAFMLGKLAQNAMTAVSLAGNVQFVLSLFLAAVTIGATMLAAQYWGKGYKNTVGQVASIALSAALPAGVLFSVLSFASPAAVMRIFSSDTEILGYGAEYLRAVSASYLLCAASQVLLCIMKNSGRTLWSSLISSVCVVINIAGNAVLIFGLFGAPALGVKGAAYATVIARTAELLFCMVDFIPKPRIKLRRPSRTLIAKYAHMTAPVLGNELVWGIGFTMGSVIMGRLGADAAAANSIAGVTKSFLICMCIGIASGGGILVGNELGAGRLELARLYGGRITRLAIASGILTGVLILFLRPVIPSLTHLSSEAEHDLRGMLLISAFYVIGKSVNSSVIGGIFCAGGDSRFGFFCDTVTLWGVVVPLGLLSAFVFRLPVLAVYLIISLDEIIKLPAVYIHYKKYKWDKDLTKEETTNG